MDQQRKQKQKYLKEEIIQKNYSSEKFEQFCLQKNNNEEIDIDSYEFSQLQALVQEFQSKNKAESIVQVNDVSDDSDEEINHQENNQEQQEFTIGTESQITVSTIESTINTTNQQSSGKKLEEIILPEEQLGDYDVSQEYIQPVQPEKQQYKKFVPCQKLTGDQIQSEDNVIITITDIEKEKGGMFKSETYFLTIKTMPYNWVVKRKLKQFIWLVNKLEQQFPGFYVPPSFYSLTDDEKSVKRKVVWYQRFLNQLLQTPEFKATKIVQNFLSIENYQNYLIAQKEMTSIKRPAKFDQIESVHGKLNFEIIPQNYLYISQAKHYCDNSRQYLTKLKEQTKSLSKQLSSIQQTTQTISEVYYKLYELGEEFTSKNNKGISDNYLTMRNLFKSWSTEFDNQSSLIKNHFHDFSKYELEEINKLKIMIDHYKKIEASYYSSCQKLLTKKDKLFFSKDISKWEIAIDQFQKLDTANIIDHKKDAYMIMLPKETKALAALKDNFAKNQRVLWEQLQNTFQVRTLQFSKEMREFIKKNMEYMANVHLTWADTSSHFAETQQYVGKIKKELYDKIKNDLV